MAGAICPSSWSINHVALRVQRTIKGQIRTSAAGQELVKSGRKTRTTVDLDLRGNLVNARGLTGLQHLDNLNGFLKGEGLIKHHYWGFWWMESRAESWTVRPALKRPRKSSDQRARMASLFVNRLIPSALQRGWGFGTCGRRRLWGPGRSVCSRHGLRTSAISAPGLSIRWSASLIACAEECCRCVGMPPSSPGKKDWPDGLVGQKASPSRVSGFPDRFQQTSPGVFTMKC